MTLNKTRDLTGSLLYLNPAHPDGRWAGDLTTVPPTWSTLPNIAYREAAQLIGSGDETTLAPTLGYHSGWTPGPGGILERTSKGGFHAIISKTNDISGQHVAINMPQLLCTYLKAAGTRSIYLALAGRVTRTGGSPNNMAGIFSGTSSRMSFGESGGQLQTSPAFSAPNMLGKTGNTPIPGAFLADVATSGNPAGFPTTDINQLLAGFGPTGGAQLHICPSWVVYTIYIEDLTASGQTYAQAHARMQEHYTKMTSPGGLYAGDTWTSPTTVP